MTTSYIVNWFYSETFTSTFFMVLESDCRTCKAQRSYVLHVTLFVLSKCLTWISSHVRMRVMNKSQIDGSRINLIFSMLTRKNYWLNMNAWLHLYRLSNIIQPFWFQPVPSKNTVFPKQYASDSITFSISRNLFFWSRLIKSIL